MLCFLLRLFNVPALAVGLVLYYTLSLESINLIPNPNQQPPVADVLWRCGAGLSVAQWLGVAQWLRVWLVMWRY